jgi:glycosyltransferase involved in cell wall biosynthesis
MNDGYDVVLVGRKHKDSEPLSPQIFRQKRLQCFFRKGFLFYAEYNLRLIYWLINQHIDIICAIDLDTILPCYFLSRIKNITRVYDAHELFTEQKEIVSRPFIHKIWMMIEKFTVPKFKHGYTVNQFIKDELHRRYKVDYSIVRNLPILTKKPFRDTFNATPVIIYQGAVNEGRSFETLIPAMRYVNAELHIYGKGNFYDETQQLIKQYKLQDRVFLKGFVLPQILKQITPHSTIAVMLFEKTGLNQYYSLSNRFFDYIMACVPQLCVNYPEYKSINDKYHVAFMIDDTAMKTIANALNQLLNDDELYNQLEQNCVIAREELCWQKEQKILLDFYKNL